MHNPSIKLTYLTTPLCLSPDFSISSNISLASKFYFLSIIKTAWIVLSTALSSGRIDLSVFLDSLTAYSHQYQLNLKISCLLVRRVRKEADGIKELSLNKSENEELH